MNEQPTNIAQKWLDGATTAPPFGQPADRAEWERRRIDIRATLWALLGELPARPAMPSVVTLSREDRGDYWLERFTFDNGAGSTVPGYLLLPKNGVARHPALLYCHWHGGHYHIGKEELFGTNATPVSPGPALVRAGYAVMAIDACGFGERNGQGPGGPDELGGEGEMTAAKFNLWVGRTLWGMIVRDDLMALDYLCARPEVDAKRVGVTGISMGATRTWWITALDERPKAAVAVACLTRYRDLILAGGLKCHGIYYFVPNMLRHFDTEAVVALTAPRALLVQNGDVDDGSPVDGIRAIESAVKPIYSLYGAGSQFVSAIYPGVGHAYTDAMWRRTLDWFGEHL